MCRYPALLVPWSSASLCTPYPPPPRDGNKNVIRLGVERRLASPTRCRSRRKKMPIYCLFPFADSFAVASSFNFSFSCLCCCCCTSQKLQWQIHGNGHLPLPALHAHAELAKMPTGCNGAHPPPFPRASQYSPSRQHTH